MYKPLSLFLGLRYVRSRHGSGFSTFISASSTLGIALGVMVLIVVLSAMNGFERELATRLLSIVPHAELIGVNAPVNDWPASIARVNKHPQVIASAPVIKMTGMMQKGDNLKGLEIRGVELTLERAVSDIDQYLISGSWQALAQDHGIVIGVGVAKKLGVGVGDQVQLLLPRQPSQHSKSQQFPVPIKRNVTVVGIFKFGGTIDETLAYMSLTHAAQTIELPEVNGVYQVHGIRLKVNDIFSAPQIAREVAYDFEHYVYLYDWTRSQGHLFNDIQLVRMVMFIVLTLVIAVASFNIVSTLVMAVNEKKGDIAILKTMGATATTIMASFMIQGLVNGVVGCVTGVICGVFLANNLTGIINHIESFFNVQFLSADVYFIDYLPSYLQQQDVIFTVIVALILSLIATLYPAWQATKVDPAQVLGQL